MRNEDKAILEGEVRRYAGNGRKLGYPTANIDTKTDMADGVYFGWADLGKYRDSPALIFIGTPTTVGDTVRRVEAHLLDIADHNYYGESLRLQVSHHHRDNETFGSVEALIDVMKADEVAARAWFAAHPLEHPRN